MDDYRNLVFSFSTSIQGFTARNDINGVRYTTHVPFYVSIKPVNCQSLVNISFRFGKGLSHKFDEGFYNKEHENLVNLGDPLTLRHTL
jgi:hypothetical protein